MAIDLLDLLDEEDREAQKGFQVNEMIGNVPSSAAQFVDDVTYPIRHPVKTVEGLNRLGSGIGQMLATDNPENYSNPENVEVAKAMRQYLSDRYGGADKILNTLETDPVGFASDFSSIVGGGGSLVAKAAGKTGKVSNIANAISKTGLALDPAALPTHAAKLLPSKALNKRGMNFRYGKGPGKVTKAQAKDLANQSYELGIRPNDAGLDKLDEARKVRGLEIDAAVQKMDRPISTEVISNAIEAQRARQLGVGSGSRSRQYVNQYDATIEDFANRVNLDDARMVDSSGQPMMTPQEAQSFKKGRYEDATPAAFGDRPKNPAEQTANKVMARAVKEALEADNPNLKGLNQRYADIDRIRDAIPWNNKSAFGTDYSTRVIAGSAGANQVTTSMLGTLSHYLRNKSVDTAMAIKWMSENNVAPNLQRQVFRQAGIAASEIDESLPKDLLEDFDAIGEY